MMALRRAVAPSIVVALLLVVAPRARADQRFAFQEQRVTISIPDRGWKLDPGPVKAVQNVIFAAKDSSGNRTVLLMAMPLREKFGLEAEGLAASVEEAIAGHAAITSIDKREFYNVDAEVIYADEHRGGTSMTMATAANGYLYVLSTYFRNGKASEDDDLLNVIRDLEFIGMPEVDYVATEPEGGYAWGYRIAGIIFFILVAGLIGFFIGRRRRAKAPAAPKETPPPDEPAV